MIGDTVDIDRRGAISHSLEGIPTIVGVIPCTTTNIDIPWAGVALFVGKAISISTIILIIEIIMGVTIDHHVMATTTQLDARITTAIDFQILQNIILTFFYPDALIARIA